MRTNTGMADSTLISVIIPAHNGEKYLGSTLQSVIEQTYRPGEVIVVDDGSTDRTVEIARGFGATVISQSRSGPGAARNAGTRAASGEFVAYLDADDLWSPDKLAVQFAALTSYAQPTFSFTDFRFFGDDGVVAAQPGLLGHPAFRRTVGDKRGQEIVYISAGNSPVLTDNYILPSSLIVRRADVLSIGGFDEKIRIGIEDYEFLLRLFRIASGVAVVRPLLLYRRHASQLSSKTISMKSAFVEIHDRVAAAPHRYPPADARYLLRSTFLQHYRIGLEHARIGEFEAAVERFGQSLAARRTLRAFAALCSARALSAPGGHRIFAALKALWKLCRRR